MTIEQRLECLERRVKRYRNALVLLVMSVCSVALIGATTDDGIIRGKGLIVTNDEGTPLIAAGANTFDGNGLLKVKSKTGQNLIYAGAAADGNGFDFHGFNKTGEGVVQLFADDYGNGVVGAYNRKGRGRTLKPGP